MEGLPWPGLVLRAREPLLGEEGLAVDGAQLLQPGTSRVPVTANGGQWRGIPLMQVPDSQQSETVTKQEGKPTLAK